MELNAAGSQGQCRDRLQTKINSLLHCAKFDALRTTQSSFISAP